MSSSRKPSIVHCEFLIWNQAFVTHWFPLLCNNYPSLIVHYAITMCKHPSLPPWLSHMCSPLSLSFLNCSLHNHSEQAFLTVSLSLPIAQSFFHVPQSLNIAQLLWSDIHHSHLGLCIAQSLGLLLCLALGSISISELHKEYDRLWYFQTVVILSWVNSICRYCILIWQDDA